MKAGSARLIALLAFVAGCAPNDQDASFRSVAGDTAVRSPCGETLVSGRTPAPDCTETGPLDTLRWIGFGPFAAIPASLRACPSPRPGVDTLRFGGIEIGENGAVSGTQFAFQRVADSIRGAQTDAEGGLSRPIAFQNLARLGASDSLTFWTSAGGVARYEHRIDLTCDRIAGSYRTVTLPFDSEQGSTRPYDTFSVDRQR